MNPGDPASAGPFEVGIIGLGDMGRLYAEVISQRGGLTVHCCDLPSRTQELREGFASNPRVHVHSDGFAVVRRAAMVIYSVEIKNIAKVVSVYGPATRPGAICCGQCSVKAPEIAAFEAHLPSDVHIVTCHSLHGPRVSPKGQTMVVTRHRASDDAYAQALRVFELFESKLVEMSAHSHDLITANTQVVTHLGFQAMGTAWKSAGLYPWENQTYLGGIDNVKILMCLRIFASKPHVYSGLAMQNTLAKEQVRQYMNSVTSLFKMMIQEDEASFVGRIHDAKRRVFQKVFDAPAPASLLLPDEVLAEYGLGSIPPSERAPNSHLSLLAMVDTWSQLGINPYDHLICNTPLFRLRLGIAEYLFRNDELLHESIHAALYSKRMRADDMEFFAAVRTWANIILHQADDSYEQLFLEVQSFFASRLEDGLKKSTTLISRLASWEEQC